MEPQMTPVFTDFLTAKAPRTPRRAIYRGGCPPWRVNSGTRRVTVIDGFFNHARRPGDSPQGPPFAAVGGNPRPFGIRDPNGRGIAIRAAARDIFRGESSSNGRGIAIRAAARHAVGGFTLVEMLVVLAVIAILISILVPVLSWAQARARVTATAGDMRSIALALDAYHADFGMYPNSGLASSSSSGLYYDSTDSKYAIPPYRADELLAEALIGYLPGALDGAPPYTSAPNPNGYAPYPSNTLEETKGFAMAPYHRVYGPYADIGSSNLTEVLPATDWSDPNVALYYFADAFPPRDGAGINFGNPGKLLPNPILYFSANPTPQPDAGNTLIFGDTTGVTTGGTDTYGIFNIPDDAGAASGGTPPAATVFPTGTYANGALAPGTTTAGTPTSASTAAAFLSLIGDNPAAGGLYNVLYPGANIIGQHSYLLIGAGPDGNYFTGDDVVYGGH